MTRQHTRDNQGYARPDTAAFLGHLNTDAGQLVHKPIPEIVGARELEEPFGDLRRPYLEDIDKPIQQDLGDGDGKEQKQQGKSRGLEGFGAKNEQEASPPENERTRGGQGGKIILPQPAPEPQGDAIKKQSAGHHNNPRKRIPGVPQDPPPFLKEEVSRNERDKQYV